MIAYGRMPVRAWDGTSYDRVSGPMEALGRDMWETDDALYVLFDLAGVDADKTEVRAEPHALTVRGVRSGRHAPLHAEHADRSYHALEIPYGRFERTLRLPPGIDAESASATYRDGLLEIMLPKRMARQVPITTQAASSTDATRR